MNAEAIIALIRAEVRPDIYGDLYGVDGVAEYLADEIRRAENRGYFRAMEDIRSGELERINNL